MPSEVSVLNRLLRNSKNERDPLTPLIDEYMLKRERSKERCWDYPAEIEDRLRPPGRLSPSALCGCPRQAVYKYVGMEGRKKIDPETEAIFDDGKWRHLKLGWMLKDMEAVLGKDVIEVISIEENVWFPDLFIAGALDIVVRIYGLLWVIDFKGINSYGFEYVFKNDQPKAEHVLQLIAYCRMRKVKRGMLLYENKNDNRKNIFVVRWTKERWSQVEEWCQEVIQAMELRRLPPMHPDCQDGRYLYTRCPFRRHCFGSQTAAQLERNAYVDFPGVKALWQLGNELAET